MISRKPFQHLRPEGWLRLALFALGVFYAVFTAGVLLKSGPFAPAGVDFRALFAAARIAATSGFAQVYNLAAQNEVQEALMAPYHPPEVSSPPVLLLPVFVAPFCALLPLGLVGGLIVWTVCNLIVLVIYLVWFLRVSQSDQGDTPRFSGEQTDRTLIALSLLSFPVFTNFFLGQTNVWLLVCIGEFLRAWKQGRPFRSGLWLGGLLLKPQTLPLVLPFLALSGEWRILSGFAVASAVVGAISLILAGPEGLRTWAILLAHYTNNLPTAALPTTNPEAMMNLRMLGEVLSVLFASEAMRGIVTGLAVGVALLTLWRSLQVSKRTPEERTGPLLSLLAATFTVTWHSHIHMATMLVPSFLRQVSTGQMPRRLFVLWTVLPPAVYFLAMVGMALLNAWGRPIPPFPGFTYPALALFIFHIYLAIRGPCCGIPKTGEVP